MGHPVYIYIYIYIYIFIYTYIYKGNNNVAARGECCYWGVAEKRLLCIVGSFHAYRQSIWETVFLGAFLCGKTTFVAPRNARKIVLK